jgi:hypothetical protein
MSPEFSDSVADSLGADRIRRLRAAIDRLDHYASNVPERAAWLWLRPVPLASETTTGAIEEFEAYLRPHGRGWHSLVGVKESGERVGIAFDGFTPTDPASMVGQLLIIDIHMSLGGWWTTHAWRVQDLAGSAVGAIEDWRIITAAPVIRSLFEGVAAFSVEGRSILKEWSDLKAGGLPGESRVHAFRQSVLGLLTQAQFGTRLGERSDHASRGIRRRSILTLLEKFGRLQSDDFWEAYEWLCDAVHPSFGFGTVYVAAQGCHHAGTSIAADLAKRVIDSPTADQRFTPNVAHACVDLYCDAVEAFLRFAREIRWLVDDIGLTTGVAFGAPTYVVGGLPRVTPVGCCPCGSGVTIDDCCHYWGRPANPPSAVVGGDDE